MIGTVLLLKIKNELYCICKKGEYGTKINKSRKRIKTFYRSDYFISSLLLLLLLLLVLLWLLPWIIASAIRIKHNEMSDW